MALNGWASRLLKEREDGAEVACSTIINSARKMPSADGELRKSLLRSLLKGKKYRKMYLDALRNSNNI